MRPHVKPKVRVDRRGHDALIRAKLREHLPAALAEQATARREGRPACWALCRERTGLIAEAERVGIV